MIAIGCLLVAGIFRCSRPTLRWANILKEFIALKIRKSISTYFEAGLLRTNPGTVCYDLSYYDGTSNYIVRFPKVRGPSKYSHVIDENGKDVTARIKEYAGPCHNFHGIRVTPRFLGYESLTFFFISESSTKFTLDDPVVI